MQISHLSKTVGMWLLSPPLFELIATIVKERKREKREKKREKERKREKKRKERKTKHQQSWTFQSDRIVL